MMKRKRSIGVIILGILLLMFAWAQYGFAEVPIESITPQKLNYKDFFFSVYYEKEDPRHDAFEIYRVVIAISPGKRKHIDEKAYLEVWNDDSFVYSDTLEKVKADDLTITLRKKLKESETLLFFFRINPDFLKETWFSYQIIPDEEHGKVVSYEKDGALVKETFTEGCFFEMDCVLLLKDFIVE
ncbi:MAG: hypothetical protein ABIA97_01850 [Candidatus Omnitrophota bacterium]